MRWMLDNKGKSTIIDMADLPGHSASDYVPAILSVSGYSGGDLGYVFFTQFKMDRSANAAIAKTLDGTLIYTSFGAQPTKLKAKGIVAIPTSSNDGEGGIRDMDEFLEDNLADNAQPSANDLITITMENDVQHICLLLKGTLSKRNNPSLLVYDTAMTLLILQTN